MVWDDAGRHESHSWSETPPQLRAYRSSAPDGGLLIDASPELQDRLRLLQTDQPAASTWFRIALAPRRAAATLAAVDEPAAQCTARIELREAAGERPRLLLFFDARPQDSAAAAPPIPHFVFGTLQPLETPPGDLGTPLHAIVFTHKQVVHHDPNRVVQVALTPFAVALDVVLFPFELLGYLRLTSSGSHG